MNLKSDKNVSKLDELLKKIEGVQERIQVTSNVKGEEKEFLMLCMKLDNCILPGFTRNVKFRGKGKDEYLEVTQEFYVKNSTVERIITIPLATLECNGKRLNVDLMREVFCNMNFLDFPEGISEETMVDGIETDPLTFQEIYQLGRKEFCSWWGGKQALVGGFVCNTKKLLEFDEVRLKVNISKGNVMKLYC